MRPLTVRIKIKLPLPVLASTLVRITPAVPKTMSSRARFQIMPPQPTPAIPHTTSAVAALVKPTARYMVKYRVSTPTSSPAAPSILGSSAPKSADISSALTGTSNVASTITPLFHSSSLPSSSQSMDSDPGESRGMHPSFSSPSTFSAPPYPSFYRPHCPL